MIWRVRCSASMGLDNTSFYTTVFNCSVIWVWDSKFLGFTQRLQLWGLHPQRLPRGTWVLTRVLRQPYIAVILELYGLKRWSWTLLGGFRGQYTQWNQRNRKKIFKCFLFHLWAIYPSHFSTKLSITLTNQHLRNTWHQLPVLKLQDKLMVDRKQIWLVQIMHKSPTIMMFKMDM